MENRKRSKKEQNLDKFAAYVEDNPGASYVETRAESGWDNWVITKMEDGSVHIWTESLGARKITEPMDVVENSLEEYREKLEAEGIHPNSATGATLIEKWLNKLHP